jgi:uncharacterized protein (TIGR00297 family)
MYRFLSILGAWPTASGMPSARQLATAAAVTAGFTGLARCMRGVSRSGAVAGAVVCFLLYAGAGPGGFVALVTVFVLAWITTRWGYQRKQELGTAEKQEGRRASQVLANLSVAAVCALLHAICGGRRVYLLAMAGALSEAAADTVSSEVGQWRAATARLITSWELVPAGTDGAISLTGTLAGLAAAAGVSLACLLTGLLSSRGLGVGVISAMAGTVADSYMGAWLERRKLVTNDAVNFLSTLVAAGIAFLLA